MSLAATRAFEPCLDVHLAQDIWHAFSATRTDVAFSLFNAEWRPCCDCGVLCFANDTNPSGRLVGIGESASIVHDARAI